MVLHFDIGRDKSARALNDAAENGRKVFLTAQSEVSDDNPSADGLYQIGVVAEIKQIIRVQQGGFRVMVEGLHRAKIISIEQEEPYFIAQVRSLPTRRLTSSSGDLVSALIRTVKNLFEQYSELSPKMPRGTDDGRDGVRRPAGAFGIRRGQHAAARGGKAGNPCGIKRPAPSGDPCGNP
jgi:ATP-dependent Lon protease